MGAPSHFGSRGSYASIVLGQSTLLKIYIYLRSSLRQVGSVAVARRIFLVGPGGILGARSLSHWTVREVPHNTLYSKGFWQRPLRSVGLAWLLSLTQS